MFSTVLCRLLYKYILLVRVICENYRLRGEAIFFWPLCCICFFDLRIQITPLGSSNASVYKHCCLTSNQTSPQYTNDTTTLIFPIISSNLVTHEWDDQLIIVLQYGSKIRYVMCSTVLWYGVGNVMLMVYNATFSGLDQIIDIHIIIYYLRFTLTKQKYSKFGNTWPQQFINICVTCVQMTDDVNDRCCKLTLTVQYEHNVDR